MLKSGDKMKYKVGFVSLGCPKNLTDTETMAGILKSGCEIVTNPQKADIIIVNTCGFIESAKQESIDTILEMAQYKTGGNLKKLIVTGCLAQRYAKELRQELPEVDAVVGTGSYFEIGEIVEQVMGGAHPVRLGEPNRPVPEGLPRELATPAYTAYLKIADGCDNHCTYCIIPKLRGTYHSREMGQIVKEAEQLAARGVRELILIAQDTTRYGCDIYGKARLPELLRALEKVEGVRWIRLHYCYPELVTEELIEEIARNQKVCHYIDIPFQHASDNVLKRMGRRNTRAQSEALLKALRRAVPDIVIRSTFIVGFPGETREDFLQLKEFVSNARLDRMGVFTYSAEEGTPAAGMPNQIEEAEKLARQREIMELQQKISLEKNQEKIGGVTEVLCEEKTGKTTFVGRSFGDSPEIDGSVLVHGRGLAAGEFVKVRVRKAAEYDLEGDKIESCE